MSDLSGHPVTNYRPANSLAYRHTNPRTRQRLIPCTRGLIYQLGVNDQRRRRQATTGSNDTAKILRTPETQMLGQHGGSTASALGREPAAALGASVSQDRTTRTGAHPGPETVLACPTPVIGLESALHDCCSWGIRPMRGAAQTPDLASGERLRLRPLPCHGQTGVLCVRGPNPCQPAGIPQHPTPSRTVPAIFPSALCTRQSLARVTVRLPHLWITMWTTC